MKITERRSVGVVVEIGTLDRALQLPMRLRLLHGLRTTCDICRKAITDKYFVVGFKQGRHNMLFHESCAKEQGVENIISVEEQQRQMVEESRSRAEAGGCSIKGETEWHR